MQGKENQGQAENSQGETKEKSQDFKIDPKIIDQISEKVRLEVENQYKPQIQGLDKKISQLEKEKRDLERSQMNDEQRRADIEKEFAEKMSRIEQRERHSMIREIMADEGIDKEFFGYFTGNTEMEIREQISSFKNILETKVKQYSEKEINKKLGNGAPKGGGAGLQDKTISRADFEKLAPKEKMDIAKTHKITE